MRIFASTLLAVSLGASLVGCRSYNDKVAGAVASFEGGNFQAAEAAFASVDSPFLRGVEAGMAAFTDGRFLDARAHFEAALAASEDVLERAAIGAGSLTEGVLSLAINESQNSYGGEGYERVMLHVMLALTYLAEGRPQDVLVESRLVDEILTGEEDLYETSYGAGGIGHFLSATAYELVGKRSDAYIDYQRMADKNLAPGLVGSALKRLARRLGRRTDLERWEQRYGTGDPPPDGGASIVLIAGVGMGPAKRETRIDVPIKGGVFSWAVPSFGDGHGRTQNLALAFPESSTRVEAAVVENVEAVSKENLKDRIALVAARSAARGLLKRQLADQMRDNKNGQVLGLAADLFSIATERADLRAWRTLPRSWVAARAHVPADEEIVVELREIGGGGATVRLGTYRFLEGETMFVLARALDSGVVAHVVGGELIEPAAGGPTGPASPDPGSSGPGTLGPGSPGPSGPSGTPSTGP